MEDKKKDNNNHIVLPKMYVNICKEMPPDYADYNQTFSITYGRIDDYEIIRRISCCKYSEIYEGIRDNDDVKVAIKVLKPIKIEKIKREVKIMQILKDDPNILKLFDVIIDPISKMNSLVMEYFEHLELDHNPIANIQEIYKTFTETDIKYYLYEILKTLDYANSKGIMHRDIKPQNILVLKTLKSIKIKVSDWGLSEFYYPEKEYSTKVASRYYKAPELLLDYKYYNYSVDIWSIGCLMAGLIFKQEPFFKGKDNSDQLMKIVKILGIDDLNEYGRKYNIAIKPSLIEQLGKCSKILWKQLINTQNEKLVSIEAIDLISKMLVFDHSMRITPKEAMGHLYFANLKKDTKS